MQIPLIIQSDNLITFLKAAGKGIRLEIGDIVKAEVINAMESGDVALRIVQDNGKGGIIIAKSNIPLMKGETVLLKVMGGDSEIRLQLVGKSFESQMQPAKEVVAEIPENILKALSELSASRMKNADFTLLRSLFRSIPENIKTSHPEFSLLEKIMPEIERLNAGLLKKSVEESGILFETKLKFEVKGTESNLKTDNISSLITETDQKGLLLRIKDLMTDDHVTAALRSSGLKPEEIINGIEKFIRNIEFFQVTSRINDMLYTFLPVVWQELKDGELSFRRQRDDERESYTCDINLDLEPAGKLSASVTVFEGSFYVSFNTEKPETKDLLLAEKKRLEQQFADAGLRLQVINVGQGQEIVFGAKQRQGLDLKV